MRESNEFLARNEKRERENFCDLGKKDRGKEIQLQRFLFSPNPLLVSSSPHLIFKTCHLVPSLPQPLHMRET